MPALYSAFHLDLVGEPNWPYPRARPPVHRPPRTEGITVMSSAGELAPQLYDIFEMVASADIVLSTGHLSIQESKIIVREAANVGVKKIIFTHATGLESILTQKLGVASRNPSIQGLQEIVSLGAYLEWDYASTLHPYLRSPRLIAEGIKRFGAEKCLIVSDLGQPHNPSPVDGMYAFIRSLIRHGISEKEIRILTKENPARMLGLD